MSNWIKNTLCDLSAENLEHLLNFRIPGIRVENFIPREVCELISERVRGQSFQNYSHLKDIPVHQLGLCHNQYAHEDNSVYFSKKAEAQRVVYAIYDGLDVNPVEMVIEALRTKADRRAGVFEEPGYGSYFAGAFRLFSGHGRLHVDHAPSHIKKPWAVTEITRQMTWNIYYSVPESGGELVIHDTIHNAEKDRLKVSGDYYFPYEVLDSDERLVVLPKVGDLVIFNTQNFHEIFGNPNGLRISQTSFIGLRRDKSLGLWS